MKKSLLTKGFQLLVLMLLTSNMLNAQTLLDEKFEGTAMPAGWTFQSTNADPNYTWTFYPDFDDVEVNSGAGAPAQNEWVISPSYDLSNFSNIYLTVSPWMFVGNLADFSNNTFDFKILISPDNGQNWFEFLSDNALTINDFSGSFFYDKTISLSLQGFCGPGMNNVKVACQFTSNGASISTYIGAYLMDMKLSTETPVTTLRSAGLTEISWFTINNFPGTFELEYGPVGFTQGTGTVVSGLSGNLGSYTLPSTFCNYECYLRTNLNGAYSVWNKKSYYFKPQNLSNSNTTSTSNQINWEGTFSNYDIEYGPDGFTQGTGTLISNVAGLSYIINGLTPNSTYKYYIRANCSGTFGAWANNTFSTTTLAVNGAAISNQSIQLFPNPTSSILNIQTEEKIIDLKIIGITGRTTNVSNYANNKIDVSGLSSGMYFVEIETEKGLFKEKFVKN